MSSTSPQGALDGDGFRARRRFGRLAPAGAALLAVLVYLNALDNPFVYDDYRLIVENPSMLPDGDMRAIVVRDITRPIVSLSYAVDTRLWGRTPRGYHLTSLALHVLNVLLVYWVAWRAAEDRRRQRQGASAGTEAAGASLVVASATAGLFAVHPMLTQAVGYISGRSEVLYSAFFLLAFLAGRRWLLDGGGRWASLCVALWVLALLAKETAVMLPVALLAYDWLVLDADWATRRRRLVGLVLPLLGITIAAAATRVALLYLVEYGQAVRPDWRNALTALHAFWRYAKLFVVPQGQTVLHAMTPADTVFSVRAIAAITALLACAALIWTIRRRHSLVAFGLLWFALLLVPSSGLFTLGLGEAMAEHRAYLSSAGLFLTWGCGFGALWTSRPPRERLLVAGMVVVLLAQFSYQTYIRNVIWQDPVLLSREAVERAPTHWMARAMLAESLRQQGRCEEAIPEYRAAIAIYPREQFPYTRLARCLIAAGRLEEAAGALRELAVVQPSSRDAALGLGVFALLDNEPDRARLYFQRAMAGELRSGHADRLLAFVGGELPAADRQRICRELQSLAGSDASPDICRTEERVAGRQGPRP